MAAVVAVGSSSRVVLGLSENPDVRYSIRDEPWGVECKALYTKNVRTIRKEILRKCDQLMEADVCRGFVAVDASDVLDHGRDQHFRRSIHTAGKEIHSRLYAVKAAVMDDREFDRRLSLASGKVTAITFCAQSAFPAREMMSILAPMIIVATEPAHLKGLGRRWAERLTLGFSTVLDMEAERPGDEAPLRDQPGASRSPRARESIKEANRP